MPLQSITVNRLSAAEAQAVGADLFRQLMIGEVKTLYDRALGETLADEALGLRIRLSLEAVALNRIPWELLYDPVRRLFLACSVETPLSRYLNLTEPIRSLSVPNRICLLAVVPQSSGLNTEPDLKALEAMAESLGNRLTFEVLPGPATAEAIRAAQRQHDYHIFHYAGHGSFERNQAFIHLDGPENGEALMTAGQFANFFLDYASMRLVVLNACQGATRSSYEALVGIAPQLVLGGVPAVVAMQDKMYDEDAALFATEFYGELSSLASGGQVEVALSRARKALLQSAGDSAAFANPVLFLRAEDGRLWQARQAGPTKTAGSAPKERKSRLNIRKLSLWLGMVAAVLSIIVAILQLSENIPTAEDSSKNTAIASHLRGIVMDSNGALLADAVVTVDELPGDTLRTTSTGGFHFEKVPGAFGDRVRVYISKDGFESQNEYVTLPGPVRFKLRKID